MKRTIITIIITTMTALALVLGGATTAEAHGRGATAFPFSTSSDSGLKLSGVVTCSTITVYATHPDGERALLAVWDITGASIAAGDQVILDSIIDYESSMMAWDDVRPGSTVAIYLAGQEDGDSIRLQLFTPKCGPVR